MTNEELKKKIVEILEETEYEWTEEKNGYILQIFYDKLADTLIAAGLTFGNKHRVLVENAPIPTDYIGNECFLIPNTPPTIKQLYGDEEVEKMAKERKELKDELRSKVEYIHEQDEVVKEYKHRAARAERALHCLARSFTEAMCKDGDDTHYLVDGFIQDAYSQAEKELAEEGKDEN